MFDNVPKKPATPPADMFDAVDRQSNTAQAQSVPAAPLAPSAPPQMIVPPPTSVPPMAPPAPMAAPMRSSGFGAGKVLLVLVVGLLVLGTSGYIAYRFMVQPAEDDSVVNSVSDDVVAEDDDTSTAQDDEEEAGATDDEEETPRVNPATLLDSDGDGLTNAEELDHGTSVTKADTDGDGLGDREEVEVYETDPKDVDTDGDSFLDGQEVAGGYNPNGPGRLFSVPEEGSGS